MRIPVRASSGTPALLDIFIVNVAAPTIRSELGASGAGLQAVNAGFLFAMTLHVQGGLGYSALRAGLMFAPTALAFGAIGLTWRRWHARLQGALVPGGFAIGAGLQSHSYRGVGERTSGECG